MARVACVLNIVQQPVQGVLIIIMFLTLDYELHVGRQNTSEMITNKMIPSTPSKSIAPAFP